MKKIILILFLLFLLSQAFAAQSIINYKIPAEVRLGETLTVHGYFNDTLADSNALTLCRFDIFDSNGFLTERLSDEYIYSDGSFSTEKLLNEPKYVRGEDYNVTTTCKTATATSLFTVAQRKTLFQPLLSEFEYVTDMGNIAPFFFVLIFFFVIVGIPYLVYSWFRSRAG